MTTLKHILVTALLAAGLSFAAGCQHIILDSTGKNIGAYNYGEFSGLFNTTAPVVSAATHNATKQLGLVEVAVTTSPQKFDSTIIARDQDDLEVTIRIEEVNSRQTQLRIRWGKGGDLERSRQLYDIVDKATASSQTTAVRVVR